MDIWLEEFMTLSEFKQYLVREEVAALVHEQCRFGWIFWREDESLQQNQMINTLHKLNSDNYCSYDRLIQFWKVVKVEGRHHYLSTSNYPFYVGSLRRGICWYRKQCTIEEYIVVDMEDEEQSGGVGRAYRNNIMERSPDLRLYSTDEFHLRDVATLSGFNCYVALPLFDHHSNSCVGVLEFLTSSPMLLNDLEKLDGALQIPGLRSTLSPIASTTQMKPDSEITKILKLAMATVPRLYVAQVWVPCNVCANINTNSRCMRMATHARSPDTKRYSYYSRDYLDEYLHVCKFLHLQIDIISLNSNLCDVKISKNPLAHYVQRAMISSQFCAVSLQRTNNSSHMYIIQFFLLPKPKFREDAYGNYSVQLLSRILENLKYSYELVMSTHFLEQSETSNAIEHGSLSSLNVMKFYKEKFSESEFITYLETVDSCCRRPSSEYNDYGWVFGWPNEERFYENHANSSVVPKRTKEKIQNFVNNFTVNNWVGGGYWIIQFWEPKKEGGRCYLETVGAPYVLAYLGKGIASFRKKCMTHKYYVDDEAKQEELGPPGRVFRNGHPEITHDLFLYTSEEFSIWIESMQCCGRSRGYFALPIYDDDDDNHKCVGVLEFLGFKYSDLKSITRKLEVENLSSTHIDFHPRFLANQLVNITNSRIEALRELQRALNIPQFYAANVWVPISSNNICMELALSFDCFGPLRDFMPTHKVHWIHTKTRKGMVGMLLASENKSCFCQNICEFSIADQSLSHFNMRERCGACFAICLQSSHTTDLVYIVEFFLFKGPATYEYVRSFLNSLLPVMKDKLESFSLACGKNLGEEMVVEVIEFSDANELDYSEQEQEADEFPIRFKSVQYNQEKHQHTEVCNVAALDCRNRRKGKRKNGHNLRFEDLEPYLGKKLLKDAAKDLGVGISTIKRACRDCGIGEWPRKGKHKKNPPLFENESGSSVSQQQNTNTETTQQVVEKAEKEMIKVKYEGDNIKFEFSLSLGLTKLKEEVGMRYNLEMGTFKLKYTDEEGDEILLTKDDDLHLCRKSMIIMKKTCILLVLWL